MLAAIEQFKRGERSPNGPKPGADWLGNRNYDYVIVHEGEPYPVKEIIRLAVRIATGQWPPPFSGGVKQANKYATDNGFPPEPITAWRTPSQSN